MSMHWKPLNVTPLEQKETDNINQMITIVKFLFQKLYW